MNWSLLFNSSFKALYEWHILSFVFFFSSQNGGKNTNIMKLEKKKKTTQNQKQLSSSHPELGKAQFFSTVGLYPVSIPFTTYTKHTSGHQMYGGFSPQEQAILGHQIVCQFWHYVPKDGIRSHRLKAQSHKTVPLFPLLQMTVIMTKQL